jgi:hypothetical protein
MTALAKKHISDDLAVEDLELVIASLGDAVAYMSMNAEPVRRMLEFLDEYFDRENAGGAPTSLKISSGWSGAKLSHSHDTQYTFVQQVTKD